MYQSPVRRVKRGKLKMWKNLRNAALLLVASASLVTAPPTATDVEIIKSEEIPVAKKPVYTLQDSDQKLLALTDLNDEGVVVDTTVPEDDRGKRMLGFVQAVLQNLLQPQPIVDTITEDEKYGNTGDTLAVVGRGIVAGSETISNFINLAIEYPKNMFKSLVHRATEALNHFGSKLVGL